MKRVLKKISVTWRVLCRVSRDVENPENDIKGPGGS
jgi:hypothetical protein